jgi:general nucleoside transport system permease protein
LLGLALTACSENPQSIATQGRSAHAVRIGADAAGSALIAIGGGVLILAGAGAFSSGQMFSFGQVNGRGFLALALAVAARWRPGLALIAALLFGIVDVYQQRLQQSIGAPTAALLALAPVILVIAALAATRRSIP